MDILREFLKDVSGSLAPELWKNCRGRIEKENLHLLSLASNPLISIYGANTLTGHRETQTVTSADLKFYQKNILNTHAIGSAPWYCQYTTKCIAFAKMYSWSAGMSGVSPELFRSVGELATNSNFNPKIPKNCTYSSGDVIPSSHWAKEVLKQLKNDKAYESQPGEIMALINGNFIHVGYAASLIKKIRISWILFVELSSIFNVISQANSSNLFSISRSERDWTRASVEYIKSKSKAKFEKSTQDPVSLRALPQIIDTLCNSIEEYIKEIDSLLTKPSGNPLFDITINRPISQASFLSPVLTVKSASLLESILFVMWSMVGRTNHLLSGDVENVPLDASNENSLLGLIQYPKLMMAILENARIKNGRRTFASGSQTSYGLEDLWTNGVIVLEQIESLIDDLVMLCSVEIYIINYINENHDIDLVNNFELISLAKGCANPAEIAIKIPGFINEGGLSSVADLFPLET